MTLLKNPRYFATIAALALATLVLAKCPKDNTDYKWRGPLDKFESPAL